MREEQSLAALGALGLTAKEAASYLFLVRSGTATAREVSETLKVQYPAVYRILQSLQAKGWIDISQERPNRYHARAPAIVAEEARQSRSDDLIAAAELVGELEDLVAPRPREAKGGLWIYKGPEAIGRKLREIALAARTRIFCASPFPVDPDVLRLLVDSLGRSRRLVRIVLNETNRRDMTALGGLLSPSIRLQFRFPERPLPKTRVAHTFVFPNDQEVFILNSFYRDASFVRDKLQGLWVGDMDFVRVQLEAMLEGVQAPRRRRRLPRGA